MTIAKNKSQRPQPERKGFSDRLREELEKNINKVIVGFSKERMDTRTL